MNQAYISNVLIVDDLQENLQALEQIIAQKDRKIFAARSGDEALSLLLDHEFSLAILDVMMPGMNGFELAELMRCTERTSHIPIIFVSAAGKELNYAFKGYENGAVDFLYKPLDVAAVRSKVNVFVALHQKRKEVDHRVEELQHLHAELQQTQLELERALQMRDDFISMVAHELRTPLNTLHLESQMRQMLLEKEGAPAFPEEKLQEMVHRDSRQIQNMTRLIADMVDVASIRSGKLSLTPAEVCLETVLKRLQADLAQQAESAGCALHLQIQPGLEQAKVSFDEFRLEQVINNLLTNAFRYGAGQPVVLALERVADSAVISVRDHGTGIDEAEQQRIFDKFERVGSNTVKEGLGMGLYIARQLAEAQGGHLEVQSKLGEGAVFRLVLPFLAGAPVAARPGTLASG